jgi:3-hydroxyisobutyrate dehydrogenase-like beta-hydroxyacid dehydrogenase
MCYNGVVTRNATTIAFIGFGEVGKRFARDLIANDGICIAAYDIITDDPARRPVMEEATRAIGVTCATSANSACRGADIVISAVTADKTEAVAADAARFLTAGQIYLDVNSASPSTKKRAAAAVNTSGASYVEAAVMAAVLQPGIRVPILAGGPAAEAAAIRLNKLGMNLTPVASEYGRASAIKLCRSIMIKGIEALMVDCARASRHWDVERDVFGSLGQTFPSILWSDLAHAMAERVAKHGVRRAAEMREAAEMLTEIGLDPALARAVANAQERGAHLAGRHEEDG